MYRRIGGNARMEYAHQRVQQLVYAAYSMHQILHSNVCIV